ncbi:MAG: hypothetical protein KJO95_00935 [Gammaproteobacteria bacterium]|nr:hypothetical protein [Gammaproteobacteria bacterium]
MRKSSFTMALIIVLMSACASNSELVLSKLDPKTSVTINYDKSPFIFFRSLSPTQADAKEYVYVGPLEVNRSGDYRYYLWVATWSTMDNAQAVRRRDRFESIEVVADGAPLALKTSGASLETIGASEPVYPKPVGWATENYYDVTLAQLRVIAESTELQLQFTATGETYLPWDDQESSMNGLREFLFRSEF